MGRRTTPKARRAGGRAMTGLIARRADRPTRYVAHRLIQRFDIFDGDELVAHAEFSIFSAGGTYLEAHDLEGHVIESFDPRRARIREVIEDEIYSTTTATA